MASIFVYGSLIHPTVLKRVLAASGQPDPPAGLPAVLKGYRRHPVLGEAYPACIPGPPEGTVQGLLIRGLLPEHIRLLDIFEGDEYAREAVTLVLGADPDDASAVRASADVYVWRGPHSRLALDQEWSFSAFQQRGLVQFLDAYAGYDWVASASNAR
ncbi:hypothetical protein THASP1DRAFT_21423 [Thamnocephalis sphaerospora]|uniref:Putative gamma-glutamylcyclotransferase n=1 Tax=Thamnocephalis sphaerospora TaxID=78915 RepID=A0A4P9XWW7_9FUNG|nr:hypothetical protein THASP1DRAFT_21423 [Thamnocephalis sphaerospora]|eukprot:RKP10923.1 hypothetical protein THASP1DRAFT_21423 [Thamnocephalis sphaerospora]